MKQCYPTVRCCDPCTGNKKAGKILRLLFLAFNILLWFAGCAILSVAVWLLFIDHATTSYYSTFAPMTTALYILLTAGILFLVISFIGMCGGSNKRETFLSLSLLFIFLVTIAQVIGIIVLTYQRDTVVGQADQWYRDIFIGYPVSDKDKKIVDHFQKSLKCCGLTKPNDFRHRFSNVTSLPASCSGETVLQPIVITQRVYSEGCLVRIKQQINWLIGAWPLWFSATLLFILELGAFVSGLLFLIYQFRRGKFDFDNEEDEESSELIEAKNVPSVRGLASLKRNFMLAQDLPLPKLYRIVRTSTKDTFGFSIGFKNDTFVVDNVDSDSMADFAGLKQDSQVVEINGLMTHNASREDVQYKLEFAEREVRLLVVDKSTSEMYEENKVDINLRNVEGVTGGACEYRPRLCKVEKSDSGFGFSLLYLEDRKGEFVEDLSPNGSGDKAGLKIGDRIVEVNGVNVERENSRDVVSRIRVSGDVVFMLVIDPKADGYFRKKSVTTTASLAEDYFNSRIKVKLAPTPKPRRKSRRDVKPRYCRLVKRNKEEFGLYVVIDNNRIGQVIRWVDCGGAADRAGLRIGDRIVEVNGQNVEYEAHQRLISAICANKNTADLIVVDEEYDVVYKRNKPRLCRIFKDRDAFGFCVDFNSDKDGHYVTEVDPRGPADRAGLSIGDRVIQINGSSVESSANEELVDRLRSCESEVVLLVIDSKSAKHYKQIAQFKTTGLNDVDYDAISIPEEPVFVSKDPDSEDEASREPEIKMDDSIILLGARDYPSVSGEDSLRGKPISTERKSGPRDCVLRKDTKDDHGFFLAIDRDRNGQIIRRVVEGGAAERAGLMDGDRVLRINGENVEAYEHDEVVSIIRDCGNVIQFTVVDERSDDFGVRGGSSLFRISREKGGYGFYLWYDEVGHFVQDVSADSPADKAGLRPGDRLVEINGVNVEQDSHQDVFYRIKACANVVTLLALDAKTHAHYKRNSMEMSSKKLQSITDSDPHHSMPGETRTVRHQVELHKLKRDDDYGFHLAYSDSFMGGSKRKGGHVIHWLQRGGAADVAGLRDGDRIIEVNGVNVESEDHEQAVIRIHANGKNRIELTVEFDEEVQLPHDVSISKENGSFGFYLWFDDNGHYIEDVTIGSTADAAGLKVGDRLLEVNGKSIENENHEATVGHVVDSGDLVTLNVVSVNRGNVGEVAAAPKTCHIVKQFGSYGFCIQEDSQGLYVEFVQPKSAAEKAGLLAGDRLLEINGESAKDTSHTQAISIIIRSHSSISLTVLSAKKQTNQAATRKKQGSENQLKLQHDYGVPAIFNQLLAKDEINYVVEERKYNNKHEEDGAELKEEKSGTDMRDIERPSRSSIRRINKARASLRRKNKASLKKKRAANIKTSFRKGEENIAFDDDGEAKEMDTEYIEGKFLDQTLKRAEKHATTRRRTGAKRPGIRDYGKDFKIEAGTNRPKRSSGGTQTRKQFHVATSGTLRWNFDETDSRRPGHVVSRRMSESLFAPQTKCDVNSSDVAGNDVMVTTSPGSLANTPLEEDEFVFEDNSMDIKI